MRSASHHCIYLSQYARFVAESRDTCETGCEGTATRTAYNGTHVCAGCYSVMDTPDLD